MATPNGAQYRENEILAKKYCPLLVAFPEIEDGSTRSSKHHSHSREPEKPPLDQDYYPRDVRLILDQALLPGSKGKLSRQELLEALSNNQFRGKKLERIDLIDGGGPEDVDKFWRVYAGIPKKDDNPEYHRKAYARIVRGFGHFENYISIQYWLAYFFNDFANVHETDWEMVSVLLKKDKGTEKPIACVFNAHISGFRKAWKDVQKADDNGKRYAEGLHPVAYIANGSHASYFSDYPSNFTVTEAYLSPLLNKVVNMTRIARDFTDYIPDFEKAARFFPEVATVPEPEKDGKWTGEWGWLNFKGNWGSSVNLSLRQRLIALLPIIGRPILKMDILLHMPVREAGPTGPATRPSWNKPFDWANLDCFDAPNSPNWVGQLGGEDENRL